MVYEGRIYRILDTTSGDKDGRQWSRQDFIFEYFERPEDRWSDKVMLSIMNERIKEYDLHEGDEVKIGFGHSVREYNGRWFNDVRVYHFEKLKQAAPEAAPQEPQKAAPQAAAPIIEFAEEKDDLPF